MTRPIHRYAIDKAYYAPPKQTISSRLFSNPWPYAVSPLQAYLLGVFGCLSAFVLCIFVSHSISKMQRKRMRAMKAKRRGTRTISSCRATKYQPVEREDRINMTSSEDYVVPQQTATEQTAVPGDVPELFSFEQEGIVLDEKTDVVVNTETNDSSYELYKHMSSFPLNMGVGTGNSAVLDTNCPSVEDDNKQESNSTAGCNESEATSQVLAEATSPDTKANYNGASRSEKEVVNDEVIIASEVSDGINDKESMSGNGDSVLVTSDQVLIGSIVNISCDQVDKLDNIGNSNVEASQEHVIDEEASQERVIDHLCDESSTNDTESISTTEFVVNETPTSSPRDQANVSSQSSSELIFSTQNDSIKELAESADEMDKGVQEDVCTSHLIVLLSNGVADSTHAVNQAGALKLLDDLQLPYQVVDGMDSHQHKKREELFSISGIRGNLPQIFICEEVQPRYLGGYDWLAETIADISGTTQGTALLSAVGQKKKPLQSISEANDQAKVRVTVLISNGVADYIQKARQKSALQLLTDLNISHKIVDGMDSNQADERNVLFKISGLRGQYPQLFLFDEDTNQNRYLGGYDWLESQSPMDLAASLE
ncbi:hypothetical protein ACHAXN_003761 [Cyclotella atomus]